MNNGQAPGVGTGDLLGVRPRTRFGHPITLRNGEDSALWAGDQIAVLRRSGNHALCAIEWNTYTSHPCRIEAWLPKRRLRFASPNDGDQRRAELAQSKSQPQPRALSVSTGWGFTAKT